MRADLVAVLRCSVCGDGLELRDRTARCGRGHAYDLAKQGYLNLLPSASTGIDGDSAEMVDARAAFLSRGWYAPIREALVDSLPKVEQASAGDFLGPDQQVAANLGGLGPGDAERRPADGDAPQAPAGGDWPRPLVGGDVPRRLADDDRPQALLGGDGPRRLADGDRPQALVGGDVPRLMTEDDAPRPLRHGDAPGLLADGDARRPVAVEVGAGTAYYLAGVIDAGWRGIAVDVSRYAARRAAKVDPGIGSVVADAWRGLPVRDGVADVVLDVFAPRNAGEMARVLAPGGTLLVVTPNQQHLGELIDGLGMVSVDGEKERRLVESLAGFERVEQRVVETTMRLDHEAIEQLVGMTPSARHVDRRARAERIGVLADPMEVTLSVTVSAWRTA